MGPIVNTVIKNSGNGINKVGDRFGQRIISSQNSLVRRTETMEKVIKSNIN